MKYNLFIGRFSPFHNGHKTIIDSFVNNNKPVCIAVRESLEPYPLSLRIAMIKAVYINELKSGIVRVITIPDVEMVVVGRNVGYSIVEVPEDIKIISGTEIRKGNDKDNLPIEVKELIELWKK